MRFPLRIKLVQRHQQFPQTPHTSLVTFRNGWVIWFGPFDSMNRFKKPNDSLILIRRGSKCLCTAAPCVIIKYRACFKMTIHHYFFNVCLALCQLHLDGFVRTSVKLCESVQLTRFNEQRVVGINTRSVCFKAIFKRVSHAWKLECCKYDWLETLVFLSTTKHFRATRIASLPKKAGLSYF